MITTFLSLSLAFAVDSAAVGPDAHASRSARATPQARRRVQTRAKAAPVGHGTTPTSTRTNVRMGSRLRLRADDDRFVGVRRRLKQDGARRGGPVRVYLNGRGGRILAGNEDAANDRSSIVWGDGQGAVDVPAYAGSTSRWNAMVACVEHHFEPYDVEITDQRPSQGSYIMMMVGGRSSLLGYPGSVTGVAPYGGGVIDDAIGFVFADTMASDPGQVCGTTAHEIGHTLGLDHTYECRDLMSYLGGCGAKSFLDQSMACGEWDDRGCSSGEARQNSHQRLVRAVGLRSPGPSPGNPTPPKPTPPRPTPTPPADGQGPRVSVRSMGGTTFEAGSVLVVQFGASDRSGLAALELLWQADGRTTVFRCGELPSNLPIECGMIGGDYAFALAVGEGERRFAIRVTDGAGNVTTTRWRRASFVDSDPRWGDDHGSCH